jgi:SOS response regulatory protein OraA/RecX
MVGGITKYLREYYDFPKFCEKVAEAFRQRGFISKRDLNREFCRNMRWGNELDRVIDQLKKQGLIEDAKLAPPTGGNPATGWKWIG